MVKGATNRVIIYADGCALGNPGPGGYGVVLIRGEQRKEIFGGYRFTTNNRMELMACIKGLQELKRRSDVTIYTDSQYVANGIRMARRWQQNGWRTARGDAVKNRDLWEQLLSLCKRHRVSVIWIRGHMGIEENERSNELAQKAAQGGNLLVDEGYDFRPTDIKQGQ